MPVAIVVDTDVVRSAASSPDPHAKLCAEILDGIKERDFILAMSEPLKKEWLAVRKSPAGRWDRYISLYAYEWWSDMQSRQRTLRYEIDRAQGDEILAGFEDENIHARVEKDLPVVLTALAADDRLISHNRRERNHFRNACAWAACLESLLWPWPLEAVPGWLAQGAPDETGYRLCVRDE